MAGVPTDSSEGHEPSDGGDGAPEDAAQLRALFRRLLDSDEMLGFLRRELPGWSEEPLDVLDCGVKPAKTVQSRKAVRTGRSGFVFRLTVARASGRTQEVVLLGRAPVGEGFPGPELGRRAAQLREHPAVAPFQRLAGRIPALRLGLLLFPLDPDLPALAEITGLDAPQLLAPHLPECRAGGRLVECSWELRHYKPGERAVLRVRAGFAPGSATTEARHVYVKLFDDEHGAVSHRLLRALQETARGSQWLRVPEPLGYDAARRLLVLAEIPGGRALAEWIHCLEHSTPLPVGVDLGRVESAVLAAARALAELQRSDVRPAATRSFADVLATLRKDRDLLQNGAYEAEPELVARSLALVQRLESYAPVDELLVPSHGGARHKQTVGDEHGLTFIDWDGFCLANPALDAATFLTRLGLEAMTNPGAAPELAHLVERFRAEFLARSRASACDLLLYEGVVLTEQALRSFRRSARDAHPPVLPMIGAAEQRLDRSASRG